MAAKNGCPPKPDPTSTATPPQSLPAPESPARHPHPESALRQMFRTYHPETMGAAWATAEECLARAWHLTEALSAYADTSACDAWNMHVSLAAVSDLLCLAYQMLEWWSDEDELVRRGWQPPPAAEGQA
jgi:hypothetical protein